MLTRLLATISDTSLQLRSRAQHGSRLSDETGGVLEWVVISVAGLTLALLIYAALNDTISSWIGQLNSTF